MKEVLAELALMNWTLAALTLALKPEQLGANPMLSHQNFTQWQQNPRQGAIPRPSSDLEQLQVIQENLLDAISYLKICHTSLEKSGLSKQYSQLFTAVADALNATSDAIERCEDTPDESPVLIPETHD